MDSKILAQGYGFATYPSVKLMAEKLSIKTGKKSLSFVKELIFGDYVKPILANGQPIELKKGSKTYIKVRARRADGYILSKEIQAQRVLEVNFIDVGQGDGCHVVTPDDKHFIIDAGKSDNMYRFLAWRFNLKYANTSPPPFTAVISHSDEDHYGGFTKLFTQQRDFKNQFSFEAIYHNGIVEESGSSISSLGKIHTDTNGVDYVTDLCDTEAHFQARSTAAIKPGKYIKMLRKTTAPKKSLRYGNPPLYNSGNLKIEVLGPIAQKVQSKDALPIFDSNKGRTKNGHSVILKLTIGKLKMLLGGDLNSTAEEYLFKCISGTNIDELKKKINDPNTSQQERKNAQKKIDDAVEEAAKSFGVDIAKSCHHGSADFTNEFLKTINPVATVISSGDDEPHCHPRPDTLGTIGKYSRGNRSLIFCTELARSGKEFLDLTKISPNKKKERLVVVYGMINVRTDGEKVIVAQKLERPGSSKNWDINKLVWNTKNNEFEYID